MRLMVAMLMRCKRAASAAEYAILLGMIATALVAGLTLLGEAINEPYDNFATELTP
jgi:Flp pilus assembly pilin Flp